MSQTYFDRINKDDKKAAKEQLELTAEEASIQIQRDVFDLKSQMKSAERSVDKAKSAVPFNSSNVLEAIADYEASKEAYDAIVDLQKELFAKKQA